MYTAHYDHLGFVPGMSGDNIYNGAADNATGCGMLLEMARAWAASGIKPPHSVIFAAVTAEEQGLLGSEYLGQHPPIPAVADRARHQLRHDPADRHSARGQRQRSAAHHLLLRRCRRRQNASTSPSFPTLTPRPAATTAPTTSRSRASAFPPSRSIRANSSKATIAPGAKPKARTSSTHDYHNFSDNYHADWDFNGNAKLLRFGMELGWEAISAPTADPVAARTTSSKRRARSQWRVISRCPSSSTRPVPHPSAPSRPGNIRW